MPATRRQLLTAGALVGIGAIAGCGASARRSAPRPSPVRSTQAMTPSPTASPVPVRTTEIDHGPRTTQSVALTFHGQGDPALAQDVLAELERVGARCTVFAVGTWLTANPQLAGRVRRGGHELANHTWHHLPMAAMGESEALREIRGCAEELQRLTGSIGSYVRQSGTPHASPAVLAAAHRAGYPTVVGYDVDSLDWTDPGADAVVRNVSAGARPGSIVSLHLGHPGTVTALPSVLAGLRGRGLRAVTVSTLLGR